MADLAIALFLERIDVLMESVQDGDGFSIYGRKHLVLEFRGTVLRSDFCLKGCYALSSPQSGPKALKCQPHGRHGESQCLRFRREIYRSEEAILEVHSNIMEYEGECS